ncbi:glycosyl transferase family 9 [Gloeocapsa sp. PCC 7428]|uniref:glycosyltransferase family 9 protein n=1 Tax=Gloeocapsa sp. PCC 7428 TaxID=1173026 RepID=UPI0002A5F2FB|nr:glycosyltransferase family 9 protein [Gloeocapsa sp. PCC 7428]AFZ32437.1 glycosyl transferase family 9 [Gloeocapsa sp. PCC 7428]
MSVSDRIGNPSRIAIVRSLPGLGDLLCAVPALRALRTALPAAEITLIGLPWAQSFVRRFDCYLDAWLAFPGYPGIPEGWHSPQRTNDGLTQIQAQAFDLAIQMHGSGIVINSFTVLLGAKCNAGFFLPRHYCPDPQRFLAYPEHAPEVRRHLQLMEFLGVPLQGEHLEFPLLKSDWLELQQIPETRSLLPGKYVCVHPGASVSDRRWSPVAFARVADAIGKMGFEVVLTGTAAETDLTQTVAGLMQKSAINLAGQTSLGALAALLKNAALLVCNDTGVSHLADALAVKSVVIFTNSDPKRWSPLNCDRHRVVMPSASDSVAAVLVEVQDLLQREVAYAN